MDDATEFAAFAAKMRALCSRFRVLPTDPLIDGYWMALSGCTPDDISAAITRATVELDRMPNAKALRDMCMGDPSAAAAEAWSEVVQAVSSVGRYRSVDFADPTINAALRSMGGWVRLCNRGGDDFHIWARKEFVAAYADYRRRGQLDEHQCAHLPGAHERDQSAISEPPALIGTPRRRRLTSG